MSALTSKTRDVRQETRGDVRPRRMEAVPSDDALLKRLRARDPAAQAELFRRYHGMLWKKALRIVCNPALADEVVQEAWISAVAAIDSFEGRSGLRTWMTSIVLNEARMQRRRESRSSPLSSFVERERSRCRPQHDEAREADWPDRVFGGKDETPERLLLEKEAVERLERALGALPRTQRSVVVLRDFHGATPAEARDALAITDLAHRVRLCRARATIRRVLEDDQRLCA
jgi:RNA polymerase sigma-70 factor, ECF subfamily